MKNVNLNVVALKYLPWKAPTLEEIRSVICFVLFFSALWMEYHMVEILYNVNVLCFSAHVKCISSDTDREIQTAFTLYHNPTFLPHTNDNIKQMY